MSSPGAWQHARAMDFQLSRYVPSSGLYGDPCVTSGPIAQEIQGRGIFNHLL